MAIIDVLTRIAGSGNKEFPMPEVKEAPTSELMEDLPTEALPDSHWIYQVWSQVLDAEVWFAHCQQEVDQLIERGIQRGIIYTESELAELIQLPYPTSQDLKDIHQAKVYFNATVIPLIEGDGK